MGGEGMEEVVRGRMVDECLRRYRMITRNCRS